MTGTSLVITCLTYLVDLGRNIQACDDWDESCDYVSHLLGRTG